MNDEVLRDPSRERDLLAEVHELVQIGAWEWEIDSGDLWWSDEVYRIFGHEPREFPATYQSFIEHIHPDDRMDVWHCAEAALAGTAEYDTRHRIVRPDGTVRHVHGRGRVTRRDDGHPIWMLGTVLDITDDALRQIEHNEALRELAASEERYRLLAENAWDVIWTMALDGSITYVSPSVERVRGITPEEAMAQTPEQIHPPASVADQADYYVRLFAAIQAGTEPPSYHGEQEYFRKDGSIMLGELDVVPQVDADGHVVQILGVTRDISERRHLEDELTRLAVTDSLTGAWNRRQGEKLFGADLAEARRYGPALTLLMLDIDHFKAINDTHGHQAGDYVLIELTRRLTENLRSSDALVRWGGEEFVIEMRHCTIDDAIPLAEKLQALVADTPFAGVGAVTVTIGATQLRPDDDLASWLHRADRAMYAGKVAGRNRVGTTS